MSLKKRAELGPNLEAIAKEYLAYELELLELISMMRTRLQSGLASSEVDDLIAAEEIVAARLLATVEDLPDLRGDEVTHVLFNRIAALKNEITLMRAEYNDSVGRCNTRIQGLSAMILAKFLGYEDAEPLWLDFGEIQRAGPAQG